MARRVRLLLTVSLHLAGFILPAHGGGFGGLLGGGYGAPTKWHAAGELIYRLEGSPAPGGFIGGAQIGVGGLAGSLGFYRSVGKSTKLVGLQILGGRTFSDPLTLAPERSFVGAEVLCAPLPLVFVHAGVLHHQGKTAVGWRVGVRIPIPLLAGVGPYH